MNEPRGPMYRLGGQGDNYQVKCVSLAPLPRFFSWWNKEKGVLILPVLAKLQYAG
jgi:hypothetical protein